MAGKTYALAALSNALRQQGRSDEADKIGYAARLAAQHVGNPELKRKIESNLMTERVHIRGDDPGQHSVEDLMFKRTNHEIKKAQEALLVEFMQILETSFGNNSDEGVRRGTAIQDREVTCWECGHSFPLLHGLRPPPTVLVCPQCQSPLAGFQEP